jgi:hypothetical protein
MAAVELPRLSLLRWHLFNIEALKAAASTNNEEQSTLAPPMFDIEALKAAASTNIEE